MSYGDRVSTSAQRWSDDLATWAIPREILEQADTPPWIHPVAQFTAPDGDIPDSPSHATARAALPVDGVVLDVGCGGGRAAVALTPRAGHLVGVDHQQVMLDAFNDAALRRGVRATTYLGGWPEIADVVPLVDVAVCHHVVYNVPALPAFLRALDTHARHRVVLELPTRHPLSWLNPLWQRFWDLRRPTRPTAYDALDVARDCGFDAHITEFDDVAERIPLDPRAQAEAACIRLCLPTSRADEVAAAIADLPAQPRRLATIWWDTAPSG